MIRILLVEDHNIVRNGLKVVLSAEQGLEVAAACALATEALALLANGLEADLVLTDINMPGMDGITFIDTIRQRYPAMKTIALSMHDQDSYINQAFRRGVDAYLLKNVSPEELIFGIHHVVEKEERYICAELSMKMLDRQLQSAELTLPDDLDFDLSAKEMEILKLVAEGFTNIEIAERMNTSKRTVEGHRQNLIDKTGVRNSIALVRFAIVNGLIP